MNVFFKDNLINYYNIKGCCNVIMCLLKNTIKSSDDDLKNILSKFGIVVEIDKLEELDLEPCETFIKNIEVDSDSGNANSIFTAYIHKELFKYNYDNEIYFTWIYDHKGWLIEKIYKFKFNNTI